MLLNEIIPVQHTPIYRVGLQLFSALQKFGRLVLLEVMFILELHFAKTQGKYLSFRAHNFFT